MLFSTKAEYGVRLLVELGRRGDDGPVALASVAQAETLPLSYLEHLVAKLRAADEITMLEVVEALEGPVAPMECFHTDREGKVLCSHEEDEGGLCATKMLWTRVHGGVTRALAGTTLDELVNFSTPKETTTVA
jgi:Rrf2 family transcriptional regulator, cysteine metabolism repressor